MNKIQLFRLVNLIYSGERRFMDLVLLVQFLTKSFTCIVMSSIAIELE